MKPWAVVGSLFVCSVAVASESAPPSPPALSVIHVPRAQVPAGGQLKLEAQAKPAWMIATMTAHVRGGGDAAFRPIEFGRRLGDTYVAVADVTADLRGPIHYYVTARDQDGHEHAVFASASTPHTVLVQLDPEQAEKAAMLAAYGGRRSRLAIFGEYVSYGALVTPATTYPDLYYRAEADYLYRIFDFVGPLRIDSIRIGMGTMRAQSPPTEAFLPPPLTAVDARVERGGLDYGFSEVEWSFHSRVSLATRLLLGGNSTGFTTGLGARLRIGRALGTRAEVGFEGAGGIGVTGLFRLAWDTVERVPMSATVQITNVPIGPAGIRFLYRADYEMTPGLTLGAQLGYQARRAVGGGLSFGLASAVSW